MEVCACFAYRQKKAAISGRPLQWGFPLKLFYCGSHGDECIPEHFISCGIVAAIVENLAMVGDFCCDHN
jgi:hypothetical protein